MHSKEISKLVKLPRFKKLPHFRMTDKSPSKVALLGSEGVGKTEIIRRLLREPPMDCVGCEFQSITMRTNEDEDIELQIWDTAGQERYRSISAFYIRGAMGVVFVYNVSDRSSLEYIDGIWTTAHEYSSPGASFMILGHQVDPESERVISEEEGRHFAYEREALFFEICAETGFNIYTSFQALASEIVVYNKNNNDNIPLPVIEVPKKSVSERIRTWFGSTFGGTKSQGKPKPPVTNKTRTSRTKSRSVSDWIVEDNIQIIRELNRGASGVVSLCSFKGRNAALKSIKFKSDDDTDTFLREVETLVKLDHPCILEMYGVILPSKDAEGKIITEYLRNGSVGDILEKVRRGEKVTHFDATHKAIIIVGIALGMKYVHDQNYIHRDLKPSNILLDDNHYPRICDFGLSRVLSDENSMTQSIGTPLYICPDVSSESYDQRVDVWSFGLIAYEILTGESVFPRNKNALQIFVLASADPRPAIPSSIHPDFREIIAKCWSYDRNVRPSFASILASLEEIDFNITRGVDRKRVSSYYESLKNWEQQL